MKAKLFDTRSISDDWKVNKELTEDTQRIAILYKVEIKENRIKSRKESIDADRAIWMEMDKLTEENASSLL